MTEKKRFRFGILHKVTLTLLSVSILPLLVVWFLTHQASNQRIVEHVDRYSQEALGKLSTYVDGWVEMNLQMLRQNARLPDIRSMETARQNPQLELITQIYDWNYLAFTVAPDGTNVGRSDGGAPRDYGDRSYVREVLGGELLGKQVVIGKTSGKPAFVFAVPILNNSFKTAGVLAIAMTITDISEQIAGAQIGESGFAFMVDSAGKVIAHPDEEITSKRRDLADHPAVAAALAGDSSVQFEEGGARKIAYATETREGWFIIVQRDYAEAFIEQTRANRTALVLLIITIVVVCLVSLLFSHRLSAPIVRLTEIADELSRGKLDAQVEGTERGDEIGELARSIGRLGSSTRLAMERLSKPSANRS